MDDASPAQLTDDLADVLEACRATVQQVDELLDRSDFLISSITREQRYLSAANDPISASTQQAELAGTEPWHRVAHILGEDFNTQD